MSVERPDAFSQAGGRSSPMGRDKALLEMGGVTFLERIARAAAAVAGRVVLVTNQPDRYAGLGLETAPDAYPGSGALVGIATALLRATTPRVVVLGCDLPFVTG